MQSRARQRIKFLQTTLVLFSIFGPSSSFTLQMGLLKVGVPQPWEKSKKNLTYVRKAGVRQFISQYEKVKDLQGDELLWGDEIEYGIFHVDKDKKEIRLSLRAKEVMDILNTKEGTHQHHVEGCNWVPEYGAWMVEATPRRPYSGYAIDLLRVERNMRLRRRRLLTALNDDEIAPTVATFPLLGALGDDGTVPPTKVGGPRTDSEYIGDDIINPHPRFGTLTENIRKRRGEKVNIRVPLFRDVNTPEYKDYTPITNVDGCCGGDSLQVWRYGKGDISMEKYGRDFVIVGCSSAPVSDLNDDEDNVVTLKKWLVDVQCEGCRGLYYRSSPGVIVADADWPRNGDVVVGSEIPDIPGWIRLQNGYYLPITSECGQVEFLKQVSTRVHSSNTEKRTLGSTTPMFRPQADSVVIGGDGELALKTLLEDKLSLGPPAATSNDNEQTATVSPNGQSSEFKKDEENVRPAIHMDAMAFGMGCCCLQITFQATDLDESRFMYDQLAVVAPIMMALTASTPILKGRIADTDCRWGIISESVDDRTTVERGRHMDEWEDQPEMAGKGKRRLYKSRYDCISTYIYQGLQGMPQAGTNNTLANRILNMYNDIPVPIDEESYQLLRDTGIDPALSQHISHLFVRDPLVIFDGAVEELDDEVQTEHFESIQSTNWQSVRWKPPPPRNNPNDPHIGWRTEFRSMEMQLTDFENAAFTVFIVLLTRTILTFDLNLYIPISRVDANMQRAHSRNAAAQGNFFFRRHMAPLEEGDDGYGVRYTSMFSRVGSQTELNSMQSPSTYDEVDEKGVSKQRRAAPVASGSDEENSYEEMTMKEIMTGKGDYFPGLIPLVRAYLDYINCDDVAHAKITKYLDFIEQRATGALITPATWMRKFVRNHPAYKGDSYVNQEIAYDLMVACKEIGEGTRHEEELLGNFHIDPISTKGAYDVKLEGRKVKNDDLFNLLSRYTNRQSFATRTHFREGAM
ncbi:hypothetical protein CTEN210_14447 [Chaetoceros tenuissimus]|uniref:glutamate--cysteine ligase n=1 Tax=Chaetoceros tenuissimus TaxID=426638 RepID=A0AAD3D503_9STRA|nr:hypothetical protein CTEN210_14447 [Chaetoceros tenuissimus]